MAETWTRRAMRIPLLAAGQRQQQPHRQSSETRRDDDDDDDDNDDDDDVDATTIACGEGVGVGSGGNVFLSRQLALSGDPHSMLVIY